MKYEQYYKEMHDKKMFKAWSDNVKTNYDQRSLDKLQGAIKATRSTTMMDFGCGTGEQYSKGNIHKKIGISQKNLYLYDIGVKKYSVRPDMPVDVTISFDVLEHIPREELPEVLTYIFSITNKFCFFAIFCGLAVKTLPNGENAHCTIMSQDSWKHFISQYNKKEIPILYNFKVPTNPKYNILNL